MAAADESIINYISYMKNVLGVKTIQANIQIEHCDLLFLNLKQATEQSIFAPECAELLDKMIQAMRLGERRHFILECELADDTKSTTQILQQYMKKVTTPFAVLFSNKPAQKSIQNLGTLSFLESYSPSYLLQNPQTKKLAWADLQKVMKEIGVL
jgi:glutamine synthetase adenylyltransferase